MYGAFADPYCYPGTTVLKNIPGLRDAKTLAQYELSLTDQRAREPLPIGHFSVRHYRSVHRHLFGDVYPWAGRFRTIRIAKEQSVFCYPQNIASEMKRAFAEIKSAKLLGGLSREAFATGAAHFLAEVNAIHPFREGNGRTQLAFMAVLGDRAGHSLDLTQIEREPLLSG
jgi:cell filamentation protein